MEHSLKIGCLMVAAILFHSCEIADIKGMFLAGGNVNQRFDESMKWNNTKPSRQINVHSDKYSILSMGDSHVGTTKNLNIFLNDAQQMNASAVVFVGDLTTGNENDYIKFSNNIPAQEAMPSFAVAGNHDLYFNGWKHFKKEFGSSTYTFTVKTSSASDLYICLDTGEGTLGSNQLDWLKDVLSNLRPDYRRCIIYTHNNLFRIRRTTSTNPLMEELHVLMALFAQHQVDMVITGHDHVSNEAKLGNTLHITMDALKDGVNNAGYLRLEVDNGIITHEFMNLN